MCPVFWHDLPKLQIFEGGRAARVGWVVFGNSFARKLKFAPTCDSHVLWQLTSIDSFATNHGISRLVLTAT